MHEIALRQQKGTHMTLNLVSRRAVLISRHLAAAVCLSALPVSGWGWTSPTAVDLNTTTARRFDTTLSAAAGSGQTRGVVWASDSEATDSLNGVFFSRSANGGASWSARQDLIGISSLPLGSWGDRPCLATDLGQTWVIGWDACRVIGSSIQGDRDIYFVRSTDGGVTWSSPATLNSNAADLSRREPLLVIRPSQAIDPVKKEGEGIRRRSPYTHALSPTAPPRRLIQSPS